MKVLMLNGSSKSNGNTFAAQDLEGMQTMRNLAKNMAWMLKCFELGKNSGIALPDSKIEVRTNVIR